MISRFCVLLASLLLGLIPYDSPAAEIHVPQDYPTIQSAVDAASNGDTIVVAPGLYIESVTVAMKELVLTSSNPGSPATVAATIIQASGNHPCLYLSAASSSVIDGFTLKDSPSGVSPTSIILSTQSFPSILNCMIEVSGQEWAINSASTWDQPMLIEGNSITAKGSPLHIGGNTVIRGNEISGHGAIEGVLSRCIIDHNIIIGCGIDVPSGGVLSRNTIVSPGIVNINGGSAFGNTLVGSRIWTNGGTIAGNSIVGSNGRAIYYEARMPIYIGDNLIADCEYGIYALGTTPAFSAVGNKILNARYCGIYSLISGILAQRNLNVLVQENLIAECPAGVMLRHGYYASSSVIGNTIVGCLGRGLDMDVQGCVVDNIIYGNGRAGQSDVAVVYEDVAFRDNLISHVSVLPGEEDHLIWGPGNIDADPLFVDPGHWDDHGTPADPSDDTFVLGDYHLLPGSPCIDAGTNDIDNPATTEVETLPATDLAGITRVIDGNRDGTATVDIGAYEYLPGDVNYDGKVNVIDLILVRNSICRDPASSPAARKADLNNDGKVNVLDLIAARNGTGKLGACPRFSTKCP